MKFIYVAYWYFSLPPPPSFLFFLLQFSTCFPSLINKLLSIPCVIKLMRVYDSETCKPHPTLHHPQIHPFPSKFDHFYEAQRSRTHFVADVATAAAFTGYQICYHTSLDTHFLVNLNVRTWRTLMIPHLLPSSLVSC